jgi:hypothetical protein
MMNDEKLREALRDSLQSMQGGDAPEFDAMWSNAKQQHRAARSRYQKIAGFVGAAAIAAVAFTLWPLNGNNVADIYLTEEDLLSSTQWIAPSDVLLPEYRIDIYAELPVLIQTNDFDEGSLL